MQRAISRLQTRFGSDYGKSKLICEEYVLGSEIKNCTILRLAPVYDQKNMLDIRKRVFLPGLSSIKMIIKPSPQYSLTSIDTVVKTVLSILSKSPDGKKIYNISDSIIDSVLYPSVDPAVFEIKYPDTNIMGRVVGDI